MAFMTLLDHDGSRCALPSEDVLPRLVALLERSMLRGRGGGAFPTATKINSAVGTRPTLIINACEGEPLVAKDFLVLQRSPGLVADGAALVARAVQAREVVFAAHQDSAMVPMLEALIAAESGRLGPATLMTVPPRYVSSEASALANAWHTGDARPLSKQRPLTSGVPLRGRPAAPAALVLNLETIARIAALWANGPGPTSWLVTVAGALSQPGVREVSGDATIAELVQAAGGDPRSQAPLLVGGYAGTWLPAEQWQRLRVADLEHVGAPLGAGLLLLLDEAECPLRTVSGILDLLAAESAGQCGPCMFGLPALAQDWRELLDPGLSRAAQSRLARRLPLVVGRGACHHPDGFAGMAGSALRVFGPHLAEHRLRGGCPDQSLVGAA